MITILSLLNEEIIIYCKDSNVERFVVNYYKCAYVAQKGERA